MGATPLISDRQLAQGFASLWRQLLPGSKSVLATLNARARYSLSVAHIDDLSPERRACSGELGFRIFEKMISQRSLEICDAESIQQLFTETEEYIRHLLPVSRRTTLEGARNQDREVASAIRDATFFAKHFGAAVTDGLIVPRPMFEGCGLLDACSGDLLEGRTLYEAKSVTGHFEQQALRQLVIYGILDTLSRSARIDHVALINPYRGVVVKMAWESLILDLTGCSVSEFENQVVEALTSLETEPM